MNDNGASRNRIIMLNKFRQWKDNPLPNMQAEPVVEEDGLANLFEWRCGIPGPAGSPFKNGHFLVYLLFPRNDFDLELYILFQPAIFHPNVDDGGLMKTTFARRFWRTMSVRDILTRIFEQMATPCLDIALETEAKRLYSTNFELYCEKASDEVLLRNGLHLASLRLD